MSILLSEINEQPSVLRRLIAAESARITAIAARIRAYAPAYVVMAARGTSDNAARYAQYVFGAHNRLSVVLSTPSLYTQYHAPPSMRGALVIGISQSGASPDLNAVVAEGRRQGCLSLALTNVPGSELAQTADEVILLNAGAERSVAATKTYTAQLLALALLAAAMNGDAAMQAEAIRVPVYVAAVLAREAAEGSAQRAAAALAGADHCVVIGRGYNFATAHEVALKAKELAYVAAEPYSAADFLHGPIALVEKGFPVIVINASGAVYADVADLCAEMVRRGAQPVVISDSAESLAQSRTPIALPPGMPEWLSPIAAIVPGQLLAYHLSIARGYDPDHPRGIQKVTLTT
jgi:glutamine---fructose-6-phosphate transaminase (isomerizing)